MVVSLEGGREGGRGERETEGGEGRRVGGTEGGRERGREGGRLGMEDGEGGREGRRDGGTEGGRDDYYTYRRNITLFGHIIHTYIHVIKQMIIMTQQIHCPFHHNI